MKPGDESFFRCPDCGSGLALENDGSLRCKKCSATFPVLRDIPRFVPPGHYAGSFGFQWRRFRKVQTGPDQASHNRDRFFATTGWPAEMPGQRILEAGCGAGRFAPVALATGAELYSFDLSEAVDACAETVALAKLEARHHLFQADLYRIPLPRESFDKIFCLGVLQHCPDVKGAFLSLVRFVKPGGELAVDCYLKERKDPWKLKYLLRPFFKWWNPALLLAFWSAVISIAYDLKKWLSRIPGIGRGLARLIPIGRLQEEFDHPFTQAEVKEMKTLSVFDMLSPAYDQPQTLESFRDWMEEADLEIVKLTLGYNGINARARRRK